VLVQQFCHCLKLRRPVVGVVLSFTGVLESNNYKIMHKLGLIFGEDLNL